VEEYTLRSEVPRGKNRPAYKLKEGQVIFGFNVEKITKTDFMDITTYQLVHELTGARYLHLDTSDLENSFAVLFRTPPDDHTGKPHVLEHLATCGSEKFPVRDPFFAMMKRSLNTYMNAWTGMDFTMYPFASQNKNDFENLMKVYTDFSFFPSLKKHDFMQEGWRLEFENWNDTKSALTYKGVVYNEMKGAMSSPSEKFVYTLNEALFKKS